MATTKVNLDAKLAQFSEHWAPMTVSKGVEHRPVAGEEVHMLLIEPAGTPNTGDPSTAAARRTL